MVTLEKRVSDSQDLTAAQSVAWLGVIHEIFGDVATAASVRGAYFKRVDAVGELRAFVRIAASGDAQAFYDAYNAGHDSVSLTSYIDSVASWEEVRASKNAVTQAMRDLVTAVHPDAIGNGLVSLQLVRGEDGGPNVSTVSWIEPLTVDEWILGIPIAGSDDGSMPL